MRAVFVALLAMLLSVPVVTSEATAQDANLAPLAFAEPLSDGSVYEVPIEGMIDNALARYLDRALTDAEANDAALVVMHIDTFGGLVDAADEIRKRLLDTPIPTVAFIDRNAASAGALISFAADKIVMAPGSSIGAATAVDGAGEKAPEKIQSYMRGLMRSTAEANGRDPDLAEAMVDERIVVEGVVDEGELLTLSTSEAVSLGLADAEAPTLDALLKLLAVDDQALVEHRASRPEQILRFLGSPVVASILMLMMMGGLYFELQTPGVGFAGAMAFVGASMFFAPHYLLGLVESWEIVLFSVGVLLLFAEIFVVPGFGVAGILGIVCTVGALFAALVPNVGLDFPDGLAMARASATLAATLVLLVALAFSLGRMLPTSKRFGALVLNPELTAAEGYTSAASDDGLLGLTGRTLTGLRPAGVAELGSQRVQVVSQGTFIDEGVEVEVVSVRGARVEVKPVVRETPA
ncbi:MAG: NfeD family protein [Bacteroidota bacterium]